MDHVLGTDAGVWLATTSISFDISVFELFWTLARGFTVVIQHEPERVARAATKTGLDARAIDFSLFYFASDAADCGRQATVFARGGEVCRRARFRRRVDA